MIFGGLCLSRKKSVFGLHLFPFLGSPRIERLHFGDLFRSELGQVADEVDEPPAAVSGLSGPVAPAGHASETDAVFDHREQLAIGKRLRGRERHVGSARVEMLAEHRLPPAIIAVAE